MIRGRPKTAIKAPSAEVKAFFEACDKRSLSLKALHAILREKVERPPSYRTLQEWRRGTHTPNFAPFDQWLSIIRAHKPQ